ncbi:hypothetical protein F5Y11DRAFT_366418 [Daldinia sp. FL1419]|nr:hypothetical protein F5Y11DRAFT_366418 [Daldinia sp. FL1419]
MSNNSDDHEGNSPPSNDFSRMDLDPPSEQPDPPPARNPSPPRPGRYVPPHLRAGADRGRRALDLDSWRRGAGPPDPVRESDTIPPAPPAPAPAPAPPRFAIPGPWRRPDPPQPPGPAPTPKAPSTRPAPAPAPAPHPPPPAPEGSTRPSRILQPDRRIPGYPSWRRTEAEREEQRRLEEEDRRRRRGGEGAEDNRPQPPQTLTVPPIDPRVQVLGEDEQYRIQNRGTWFIKSLPTSSRYYTREPSEQVPRTDEGQRLPRIEGEEHDAYDLMIVLKDAHEYTTPEDFVNAILGELSNAGEYSRDADMAGWAAGSLTKATRRLHTNIAGQDILEDFDMVLREFKSLQMELENLNRGAGAERLFTLIAEMYGWDVAELRKTGFHHEIMNFVGFTMMGRLRYMKDFGRRDRITDINSRDATDTIDQITDSSVQLSSRYFSSAIHSANLTDDTRAVEWYANWADHFPGRHKGEFERNHLDTRIVLELFEGVYKIEYHTAARLLGDRRFANDIDIINSFLCWKGTVDAVDPRNNNIHQQVQNDYYRPYVNRISEICNKYPGNDGPFWHEYESAQRSVKTLRDRLVKHMDRDRRAPYLGLGRWCRSQPPPGRVGTESERKAMLDQRWTKGWYCKEHRAWNNCISCGWQYSCAICSNAYACPNCKSPWQCVEEGCTAMSDAKRTGDNPIYSYAVAATVNPSGFQQNGRRITPNAERRYADGRFRTIRRRFFPKTAHDIPNDGPVHAKNRTMHNTNPKHHPWGGWESSTGYPSREYKYYDTEIGGEGIDAYGAPAGRADPGAGAGPGAGMALAVGGEKKRKRGEADSLYDDILSSLNAARKARR